MKRLITPALITAVLLAATLVLACGGPKAAKQESYGKAVPAGMAVTNAADIMKDPQSFGDRDVLVAGRITSECPSGGWVWIQDATGQVYVNMHPTNIFIPQKVGANVRAIGKVVVEGGAVQVVGYGLEF